MIVVDAATEGGRVQADGAAADRKVCVVADAATELGIPAGETQVLQSGGEPGVDRHHRTSARAIEDGASRRVRSVAGPVECQVLVDDDVLDERPGTDGDGCVRTGRGDGRLHGAEGAAADTDVTRRQRLDATARRVFDETRATRFALLGLLTGLAALLLGLRRARPLAAPSAVAEATLPFGVAAPPFGLSLLRGAEPQERGQHPSAGGSERTQSGTPRRRDGQRMEECSEPISVHGRAPLASVRTTRLAPP